MVATPLTERMDRLAAEERFEEAAATRDRLVAYTTALRRSLRCASLRAPALIRFATPDGSMVELEFGVVMRWCDPDGSWRLGEAGPEPEPPDQALTKGLADELSTVAAWIDRYAHRCRLEHVGGVWASAWPPPPDVRPRQPGADTRGRGTARHASVVV